MGLHFIKNGTKHDVCVKRPSLFPASATTYDNSQSGLSATRVQGAIDEVVGFMPDTWDELTMSSTSNYRSLETDNSKIYYKRISKNAYLLKIYVEVVSNTGQTFASVGTLPFTAVTWQAVTIPCFSSGSPMQVQVVGSDLRMRGGTNGQEYLSNIILTT